MHVKKKYSYIGFLKNKTEENERKYAKFKNKLTSILKDCKIDYYANLLIRYKNNIRQIWEILNTITKGDKNEHSAPAEFFICKGNEINKKEVANGLNNFFVNIGQELASYILSNNNATINRFPGNRNGKSIFLSYICEEEVLRVIDHLNHKTSAD